MKVLIILDNPLRDEKGVTRLAEELNRLGHAVFISALRVANIDVFVVKPHVVIHTYMRKNNELFLEKLFKAGVHNIIIESEGIIGNNVETYCEYIENCARFDLITKYFCWGQEQLSMLKERWEFYEPIFCALGNPRFDEMMTISSAQNSNGYILVNTNFPIINPKFAHSVEAELQSNTSTGHNYDILIEKSNATRRIQEKLCICVEMLSKIFNSATFVVRPHPFESEDYYKQRFKKDSNIVVKSTGSSITAISNASCLIQLNCTTALEAALLGVPVFMPDYFNEDILRYQASELYSLKVRDEEMLIKHVREVLSDTFNIKRASTTPLLDLPKGGSAFTIASNLVDLKSKSNFSRNRYFIYFFVRFCRMKFVKSFKKQLMVKGYDEILNNRNIERKAHLLSSRYLYQYVK